MFDTYYYIDELPAFFTDAWMVFTTGGRFHPVPGVYNLPASEGSYDVVGKWSGPAMIRMNTRGSGEAYEHPFRDYTMPCIEYDSGWYKWFADACVPASYKRAVRRVSLPPE